MQSVYDYKKFVVLYVDDEEKSLKYFTRAFEDQFRIWTAPNAQEGLKLLEEHREEIGVLMTDQRMPGEKGVWLLEKARQLRPRVIRILATAYSDMEAAISAVNSGSIYKYITKPWDPPQLEATLKRALEFFIVQRERDQLLREKMSVLHNLMLADRIVSLGLLAAGLSHHIRNSLVAVKTFLDLAPTKLKEESLEMGSLRNPDFWRDYYQNVQNQVDKINSMLKDLWEVGGNSQFSFADSVQVSDAIAPALETLQNSLAAKKIVVETQIPGDLPALLVEKPKFLRFFELMLRDETVSLPEGSRIKFSAKAYPESSAKKTGVEITVQDNGPGLPKEALRLVFDPFLVRNDSPLEYGLNLMACYFIIHHHGGTIEAKSEDGQGTTFIIRMPLNPNEAMQTQETRELVNKIVLNEALWENLVHSAPI
jgi:two-component system, probable response regulator PhcQ